MIFTQEREIVWTFIYKLISLSISQSQPSKETTWPTKESELWKKYYRQYGTMECSPIINHC